MRLILIALATTVAMSAANAQDNDNPLAANCAAQIAVLNQAKALREDGTRQRRAVRQIQRMDDPELQKISAFVPMLVGWVYENPIEQITPEFLEEWRAACLQS